MNLVNYDIIHLIPFDIGASFEKFQTENSSFNKYVESLTKMLTEQQMIISSSLKKDGSILYKLTSDIECLIYNYGVGVFIIRDNNVDEYKYCWDSNEGFSKDLAFNYYYIRKRQQSNILKDCSDDMFNLKYLRRIRKFMRVAWEQIKLKTRNYSSNSEYKKLGFSYVLTIYLLRLDSRWSNNFEDTPSLQKQVKLLMNPYSLYDVLDLTKSEGIKRKISNINEVGELEEIKLDGSIICSSWSGVIILTKNEDIIDKVLSIQSKIQSVWFLFDCLMDNIKNKSYTRMELEEHRSLIQLINVDIKNIVSANMHTSDIKIIESFIKTSNFNVISEKLETLLNTIINIEEVKIDKKKTKYALITEMLLVFITLINIYEPLKDIVENGITEKGIIVLVTLFIILITIIFFTIRKGNK
ncbi:hypothetical protein [Paenibacillus sp. FSL W7-1287]|uniref:hypothetical protein n=1 Tax=Paenibacillus sp. FSL W7-1287 TaxID=2954538 RepID=UPI0030F6A07F